MINGAYKRPEQLPRPSSEIAVLTGQHLRIIDLPASLDKKLLKAEIYRWMDDAWSDSPWGTAENSVNGEKNMWQSMVFLVAPRGSQRAEELKTEQEIQLPAGRYLIKIYVDRLDRTRADRDYELGDAELLGQEEVEGDWAPGYQLPRIVRSPRSRQVAPPYETGCCGRRERSRKPQPSMPRSLDFGES